MRKGGKAEFHQSRDNRNINPQSGTYKSLEPSKLVCLKELDRNSHNDKMIEKDNDDNNKTILSKKTIEANPSTILSLQNTIFELWEKNMISKEIQDMFMKSFSILKPKEYIETLSNEIEDLRNEETIIQKLYAAIHKRDYCIKNIKNNNYISSHVVGESNIKEKV